VFDVLVFSDSVGRDVPYRTGLGKRDAKRLVKDLRSKGKKAHFVSSRNDLDAAPEIVEDEIQQEREAQAEEIDFSQPAHDKPLPQYNRYRDAWPKKEFVNSKKDSFEEEYES